MNKLIDPLLRVLFIKIEAFFILALFLHDLTLLYTLWLHLNPFFRFFLFFFVTKFIWLAHTIIKLFDLWLLSHDLPTEDLNDLRFTFVEVSLIQRCLFVGIGLVLKLGVDFKE